MSWTVKNLTINQIIVLLDIYRGTETQKSIGTTFEDSLLLQKLGLVEPAKDKSGLMVTLEGDNMCDRIRAAIDKDNFNVKK